MGEVRNGTRACLERRYRRRMSTRSPLLLLSLCAPLGCDAPGSLDAGLDAGPDASAPPLAIPPRGRLAIERRDDGRVDVADDRGTVYLAGAWAEALVRDGTDLVDEAWDDASSTLRIRMRVDAGASDALPFEYRVRVHPPRGFSIDAASASGGAAAQEGEVVTVTFTPDAPAERELVLPFTRG